MFVGIVDEVCQPGWRGKPHHGTNHTVGGQPARVLVIKTWVCVEPSVIVFLSGSVFYVPSEWFYVVAVCHLLDSQLLLV